MADATAVRAVKACRDYDHWAREVDRLTEAIGDVVCPRTQGPTDDIGNPIHGERASCFERERYKNVHASDGEPLRRLYLSEVAAKVRDCPECSRLCALIAERKEARKRLGVAKRAIRATARLVEP